MRKPSTRYLTLAVLLCAAIAFLLVSLRGVRPETQPRAARKQTGSAARRAEASGLRAAAPADADYDRYAMIGDRNVFARSAPAAAPARSPAPKNSLPPLRPPRPKPEPDRPKRTSTPAASFDGWSYLGYVEINGTLMGLLRNDGDRSSEFVKTGDEFRGATVAEVTLDEIRLKSGSRETTLPRVESYPLVPLDRAATTGESPARSATVPRPR